MRTYIGPPARGSQCRGIQHVRAVRFARVWEYVRLLGAKCNVCAGMCGPLRASNVFGHILIAFHVCAVRFARVWEYVRVCMCAIWVQNAMYVRICGV